MSILNEKKGRKQNLPIKNLENKQCEPEERISVLIR